MHTLAGRVIAVGMLTLSVLGGVLPYANAHSELVSSTPQRDEILVALPRQVLLTFNENLMEMGASEGNVVVVKDQQGMQIDDGLSQVTGSGIAVGLIDKGQIGLMQVSYRVVSEDGHVVTGDFSFTVNSNDGQPDVQATVAASPLAEVTQPRSNNALQRVLLISFSLAAFAMWFMAHRRRNGSRD